GRQDQACIQDPIGHRGGKPVGGRWKVLVGGKGGRGRARDGDVEQHRYGGGIKVRDGQIELAIPVHIAHRDGCRGGPRDEVLVGGKAGWGGARGRAAERHRDGRCTQHRGGQIERATTDDITRRAV